MFGNHGLCGLPEEGAHEKSPKCLGGNLGDFGGDFAKVSDCYKSYDVPDVGEFSHLRINHSTHFAERQNHINGIENFWNQAKRHLRKFNGIPKEHFELYLKECERRFNNSEIKVQISILKQLVKHDLS